MKIVMLLTNSFNPDVRPYKEAKYLVNKGVDVTLLCWDKTPENNKPENEIIDGINIIRFKIKSIPGSGKKQIKPFLSYIKKCKLFLKNNNYDYLHCFDLDGVIAGKFANIKKRPYVFDMREVYEKGGKFKIFISKKIVAKFIKKSLASLYVTDYYIKSLPYSKYKNKLISLKNYPDEETVKRLPKTQSNYFRIGYHGAVRSQIPEFTALFEAVKDMADVRVDINGGGIDYDKLKAIENNYNNVYINGPYNGATESSRLYSETDLLYCGYDKTNRNYQNYTEVIKYFEAIRTGTPVLMTAGLGMAEKVVKFGYGLAVDTLNSNEIREAIIKIKTDKELYKSFSLNEINDADKYKWENEINNLFKVYRL